MTDESRDWVAELIEEADAPLREEIGELRAKIERIDQRDAPDHEAYRF